MIKNIYNIILKTSAVLMIAAGSVSCLEKFPGDAILEGESMTSFKGAEQVLTGVYSAYMSGALYSGYLTLLPDIQADLVHAVQGNSNNYGSIWQWDIRPTNSEIEAVYGSLYTVIARSNFYLDQVEELRETLIDEEEITFLDYYTGEVYCARANAYAELLKCFCEAYDPQTAHQQRGVALDSTYFGAKPAAPSTMKDSYAFVIRDLDKAIELLDEDNDYYTNPYVTNAAARAIRARVALYMQDWDKAIEYSTSVIENPAFSLAKSTVYTQGSDPMAYGAARSFTYVDYMWTHDLSTEIIWQIGFTPTSYGGSLGQVFLNFNNDYTYYYPDYMPDDWAVRLYASTDARRTAYFRTLQTGYPGNPRLNLLVKYFGNHDKFIPVNIYHVSQPKPLRLAEQYLIRAEAYCRKATPDFGKANSDLATLAQSRSASRAVVNAETWLDVISKERVKELYMEGFRLHDLKRWNRGFKRENQASAQDSYASTLEIKAGDYRFVWPIPQHEIEAPGSCMKGHQNKGY